VVIGVAELGMMKGGGGTAATEGEAAGIQNMISRSSPVSCQEAVKFKLLRSGRTMRLMLAFVMSALVMTLVVSRLKLLVDDPWSSASSPRHDEALQLWLSSNQLTEPSLLTNTEVTTSSSDTRMPVNHLLSTELPDLVPLPSAAAAAGASWPNLDPAASTVDLKACMSRIQQEMYRDSAHQFPRSRVLNHALEKYTRMHSRCALHADDSSVQMKTECRYVVYLEGYEGLGNRLLSLVSAFAYALVTQRALVIDERRGHLAQLLCEPFQNSSWLLPPQFVDQVIQGAASATLEDAMQSGFRNVNAVRVNLRHEQTRAEQRFFCPTTQQRLQNVTWIGWESNQYYVPRLFMIPSFWSLLSSWFPDTSLVFNQLIRFLCLPQNHIWEQIQRIHESYLSSSAVRVGMQVRRHLNANNATLAASVHDLIMNCSLKHQLLPKPVVPLEERGLPNGADKSGKSSRKTSVAVLVASLDMQYYEKLRNLYVEHETEDGTVVSVHMMSHEGVENYSYEQAVKAMTEIWLLSFSNKLVTSSWSTFGYVAQGLGGLHPVILNFFTIDFEHETRPACILGQSREPCLHYPFVKHSVCGKVRMSKRQSKWIEHHIRPCQDENRGLQLCSGL